MAGRFESGLAARQLAADLRDACIRAGVKLEVVARCMQLSAPRLSEQLSGQNPLNFWRVAELFDKEPEVEIQFLAIRAHRRRLHLAENDDAAETLRLVREVLALQRRMVKAELAREDLPPVRRDTA